MVLNIMDFFISSGVFIQNQIVEHFGRAVFPMGQTSPMWQDYVKDRLLPFGGPPLALAIIFAVLLPFAFLFVRCCVGKSRMSGGAPIRVIITIVAVLFTLQLVAASAFLLLSMRGINESYTTDVLPAIEDVLQSAKANLTALSTIAKNYPEVEGLAADISQFANAFELGTKDLQSGLAVSREVVHGLSIASYCFGGLGVITAILVLIFVRIKCGRGSFAILSMIAFLLFGILATAFVLAGVVVIDVEPVLDANVIVKECPTEKDFHSTIEQLVAARALAKAAMNQPGADKQKLQQTIDDTTTAIAILSNFIGCVGATKMLDPAKQAAVHVIGALFLFTSLIGVIILVLLLFLYLNVLCHGCCWSPSRKAHNVATTKYINMIQPEESQPLIFVN